MSFQDDQVFLEKYLDENLNTVLGLRLAGKYISSDNLEGAHLLLSEFLESHPNNPTAKFLMGEIAFKEGNNDKAKSHYEDTIQIDPTFAAAYHRLVTICKDDGDETEVTAIYRLLNLVNPMDKKSAAELEGKEKADASKSDLAERIQNKFQISPVEDSTSSSGADESTAKTEEDADSTVDEPSPTPDVNGSANLDIPPDGVKDDTDTEEENKETEVSEKSIEAKESEEGGDPFVVESDSDKEEDSEERAETESIESADEGKVEGVEAESEEDVSDIEKSESTEVDAFGIGETSGETSEDDGESSEEDSSDADGSDTISEEIIPEEDSGKGDDETETEEAITEETEQVEEKDSDEKDEEASLEDFSEEDSSDADGSDTISEDIATEEDSGNGDEETETEEAITEETEQVEEDDSDEKSEEISSVESSEKDSSDADGSDISSEDIVPEEDSGNGDEETETKEASTEETEQVEESDSDDKSEETLSEESSEENEKELDSEIMADSDEGESSDRAESSEEMTSEKEIDEIESESLAESDDETDSELENLVVDRDKRAFEMPPFSKETLSDVKEYAESVAVPEEDLDIEEDKNDNVDEGVESLDLPLDSEVDATATKDKVFAGENDSNEQSEDDESAADDHNMPIDSVEETDKGLHDTPSDYESWVEKDATPESMTKGESDANESHKNTFEGLLSGDETSGEVDTMELPEESDSGVTVEEEEDIQEGIDDIYSLAQIDDEEDVSPLQAWFLDKKTPQDEQDQNEHQGEEEENPDTITEPKPVPFSGESEEETKALRNTEENESEEKWDNFVESTVEKKGGGDSKDGESVSTDIDRELKNIFDEVAAPVNEQEINEANADAPDITGGVKLNSDLATFTLADIYISQSQFNEALSVLDFLEKKGENLERVASMREEIKVKIEARNK
ncbi:MAG: hypothetical protein IIC40_03795 [Candidatus Marinimicrobia bacterium]|nr:hypothetical protein [Candidatus Neomarinimicrobiota bacterium]